jgi:hypothetical protein
MDRQTASWLRLLAIVVVLLATACGAPAPSAAPQPGASPASTLPTSAPTIAPAPTLEPVASPTTAHPPTSAPAPAAVAVPTAVPAPTQRPTTTPAWTTLHSDALFTSLLHPSTWITKEQGTNLALASPSQVMEQPLGTGGATVLITRARPNPEMAGKTPEDLLQATITADWTPVGSVEAARLGGQPAATGTYSFTQNGKTVVVQFTVALTNGIATAAFLLSPAAEWEQQRPTLQKILASVTFDDPAVVEQPLPPELTRTDGLLAASDLPDGRGLVSPYQLFTLRRTEASFARWLAGIGPGLTVARPHDLQISYRVADGGDFVWTLLAYPLTEADATFYDDLLGQPQELAKALSYDPYSSSGSPISGTVLAGFDGLGEAAQGVTFEGRDYIVFRQGAVLAFVRHDKSAADGAAISPKDLVQIAQALEGRVQALIGAHTDLAKPLASAQAVEDPFLKALGKATAEGVQLPEGYQANDGYFPSFAQERLDKYDWRQVSQTQYSLSGRPGKNELTKLYVIYPLDDVEMRTFDWLLGSPERTAEYLLGSALLERGLDPPLFYSRYSRPLTETLPSGLGDSAGGISLLADLGVAQDVVLVRRGNALLVATVMYGLDAEPAAGAVALAQQLDDRAQAIFGGK